MPRHDPYAYFALSLATALSACVPAAPPPRPAATLPSPQIMLGPEMTTIVVARRGAALIATHAEPVLERRQSGPPVTEQALDDVTADATPVASAHPGLDLGQRTFTASEIATLGQALHRYCAHWPFPDDLTSLVAAHVIEPGADNDAACAGEH